MHDLLEMQAKIEEENPEPAVERDANNDVMDDILKELDGISQLSEVREEQESNNFTIQDSEPNSVRQALEGYN